MLLLDPGLHLFRSSSWPDYKQTASNAFIQTVYNVVVGRLTPPLKRQTSNQKIRTASTTAVPSSGDIRKHARNQRALLCSCVWTVIKNRCVSLPRHGSEDSTQRSPKGPRQSARPAALARPLDRDRLDTAARGKQCDKARQAWAGTPMRPTPTPAASAPVSSASGPPSTPPPPAPK